MPSTSDPHFGLDEETWRAYRKVEGVLIPLLELFSVADDVFTEENAFSSEHIRASLGRLHRQWKSTRSALDPDFNPKQYPKRPRVKVKPKKKKGRKLPATASLILSTESMLTLEKNRNKSATSGKSSAKRSAKAAKSAGRASNGR